MRPKGSVPSSIKITTGYHSHIFRTSRAEVAESRSTIVDDLNLQGWSWSHKIGEFVLINL